VVKKCNAYSCLANEKFKFLDICNFLAPGSSYSSFLKAFKIQEQKGFFPYEFFDSPQKLKYPFLPPFDSFYSSIHGANVLDDTIYQWLQTVWQEKEMKCFQDFLIWYNNLDVEPFVQAVVKLQNFYKSKNIDIFKSAISVPGIARQLLFESATEQGATFALVDNLNKDLYHSILSNITGGPSIIFHRYAEANKTKIRDGTTLCKKIVGYDANALYLWAFDQEFPVGSFVRRLSGNNFKPQFRDKFDNMFFWMDFISKSRSVDIMHSRNSGGKEKRDGRYLADGYCQQTNTIFQYDGCYYHGHVNCPLTKHITCEKWVKKHLTS
jgi:hypothetical protein